MTPTPLPATSLVSKSVPRRQPPGAARHRARHAPPHQPQTGAREPARRLSFPCQPRESLWGTAEPDAELPEAVPRYKATAGQTLPRTTSLPSFGAVERHVGKFPREVTVWLAGRFLGRLSSPNCGCRYAEDWRGDERLLIGLGVSCEIVRMEPPHALLDVELRVTGNPCGTSSMHRTRPIEGAGHRPISSPSSMSARPRETRLAASNTEPSARCVRSMAGYAAPGGQPPRRDRRMRRHPHRRGDGRTRCCAPPSRNS